LYYRYDAVVVVCKINEVPLCTKTISFCDPPRQD